MINKDEYFKKAIDTWGEDAQLDQLIEEMAELIVAINKYRRKKMGGEVKEGVLEDLYEEIADVRMLLKQMEYVFDKEQLDLFYEKKFEKFSKYLDKHIEKTKTE